MLRWIVLLSCLLCACAAPLEPTDPPNEPDPVLGTAEPPVDDGGMCPEDVDEAQCALNLCTAACMGAFALGCATVGGLCVSADVFLVGTVTVPCALGILVACGSAGSAIANCAGACS